MYLFLVPTESLATPVTDSHSREGNLALLGMRTSDSERQACSTEEEGGCSGRKGGCRGVADREMGKSEDSCPWLWGHFLRAPGGMFGL